MPVGAGKYDDLCTEAAKKTDAKGVIMIVLDGEKGSGFSIHATFEILIKLPELLENVAKQIRDDLENGSISN